MTTELWMLLASALLMQMMPLIYGPGFIAALGASRMIGNRGDLPPIEGWFTRGKRAHANLGENLLPFAAVVTVAHLAGVHSWSTRAGTELFLAARIVHAISYIAGFIPTRAPAYGMAVGGTLMVAGPVIGQLFSL